MCIKIKNVMRMHKRVKLVLFFVHNKLIIIFIWMYVGIYFICTLYSKFYYLPGCVCVYYYYVIIVCKSIFNFVVFLNGLEVCVCLIFLFIFFFKHAYDDKTTKTKNYIIIEHTIYLFVTQTWKWIIFIHI